MAAFTPIHRPRNVILLALALFLAFVGREVFLALTAAPGHAVDYAAKLEEVIESSQPKDVPRDAPDAWPLLRDIIERLATVEASLRSDPANPRGIPVDFTALMGGAHQTPRYDDDTTWDEMEALTRRGIAALGEAGVFKDLDTIASTRRAVRHIPKGPLIETLLPELGKMRQLARINGSRMTQASKAGDEQEFVRAYEETLALARISAMQGFLIEHLVGVAILSLANNQLREAMTEHPFSPETCRQLLAAMDRQLPLTPVAQAFRAERFSTLDIIQWTHTDDGHGDGRLILAAANQLGGVFPTSAAGSNSLLSKWRLFNLASIAFPGKKATTEKAEEYFSKLIAYAELSPVERRKSPFSTETWMEEHLPRRYVILRMCIPAVEKAMQSRTCSDLDVQGTRIMLALELFEAQNGRYPDTLDALVPAFLPAPPEDPIAVGPFVYRLLKPEEDTVRRADGSARPYLLYSRGRDGKDNGGKVWEKSEIMALTSPIAAGHDYVLNTPRDKPPKDDQKK